VNERGSAIQKQFLKQYLKLKMNARRHESERMFLKRIPRKQKDLKERKKLQKAKQKKNCKKLFKFNGMVDLSIFVV
jgi:hypothetical protein